MIEELREKLLASVGGLDRFASGFNNRTLGDTHRRAEMEVSGALDAITNARAAIAEAGAEYDAGAAEVEELADEWTDRFIHAWADYQHAGARTASWFVTGPARFPVEQNRKRMETEDRRRAEMLALIDGAGSWAAKRFRLARDRNLGPVGRAERELNDARRRLEQRERHQERMRAFNSALREAMRAHPDNEEAQRELIRLALVSAGYPADPEEIHERHAVNWTGGRGYAHFELANNSAEIRRLRLRVAQLERRYEAAKADAERNADGAANTADAGAEAVNGIRVVENVGMDRIQIFLPGKPDADTRQMLKRHGFRWAPSVGAWQRHLTFNGRIAAKAVMARLAGEQAGGERE